MTALPELQGRARHLADAFDIEGVKAHLCDAHGGYEVVYDTTWLEVGVYALFAPEPDRQRANSNDAIYVVLEGSGWLEVEGEEMELRRGQAAFVPAGANHRFSAYEHLSVVVISHKVAVAGKER
jgi:mannose-6-phosphate isomerase-like protein (cupin superfamily)